MVSPIHASQRKADPGTSLSSVRVFSSTRVICMLLRNRWDVRRRICCNQGGPRLFPAAYMRLQCCKIRDGRQIRYANNPRCEVSLPDTRTSRLTLIPYSINPATRFLLVRLIYYPCLFKEPRRGGSRDGHIMGITRTSRKARLAQLLSIGSRIKCWLLDATALDIWVLDQLKSLFRNATMNETLDAQLRAPQVVFFLHLLGLDTTGHSYRPHSKVLYVHTACHVHHASHTKIGIHEQYSRCRRYRSRNGAAHFWILWGPRDKLHLYGRPRDVQDWEPWGRR
jgi:hypothetical protein